MRITRPSIDIIEELIEKTEYPLIIKEELFKYIEMQAKGLSLAEAFLRINPDYL